MKSMTGFASHETQWLCNGRQVDAEWELRAVNSRGLDVRMRLPDGFAAFEHRIRARIASYVLRGSISLGLRLRVAPVEGRVAVDDDALRDLLHAVLKVQTASREAGVTLQSPTALAVLGWRGVEMQGSDPKNVSPEALEARIFADLEDLLGRMTAMRAQEGQALFEILSRHIEEVARLTQAARDLLQTRAADMKAHFKKALEEVHQASSVDPARVEQEMALLAVKADVAEELDRLQAHCEAARALLRAEGGIGRKLDFLMQEFIREANTLCSKAQHLEMTRIGLDLKAVIDQMREQVQNVE